jgi:CRISPR-associated endonuclease/helicase Cas3
LKRVAELTTQFEQSFQALTGYCPLRWQSRLFGEYFDRGELPPAVDIPTGLGKTAVMALWLIARAQGAPLPRRLVYVVDRRAVVDQATEFAVRLRRKLDQPAASKLKSALGLEDRALPISTLRGQHVDNRDWLSDPSLPAIIVGTVDMIGSRLLFSGYGVSPRMRPYQAGLLGADALILIDESHLVPPFEALLASIAGDGARYGAHNAADRELVPAFRVLPLSATSRTSGANSFRLERRDHMNDDGSVACQITHDRLAARKWLTTVEAEAGDLVATLAEQAWQLAFPSGRPGGHVSGHASRIVVFCDRREDAEKVKAALDRRAEPGKRGQAATADTELLVGARRVRERQIAAKRLEELGFIAGSQVKLAQPAFLVATSAGEVGVDLDANHMVCDLVAWERMVQRFGRVNRRGEGGADVMVVRVPPPEPKKPVAEALRKREADRTKKEERAIAQYQLSIAAHWALACPLGHLSESGGKLDVSPLALMNLAERAAGNESVREALRRATSAVPLRPGLTRPLVDAWGMTSLPEHAGRPEVQPWLRGWVDVEPQTAIIWRKHLPVRPPGQPASTQGEIEKFFDAAPTNVSEILETETFRILDWLLQRARRLLGKGKAMADTESGGDVAAAADDGAVAPEERGTGVDDPESERDVQPAQRLAADALVGFVLTSSGKYERGLRLRDLAVDDKRQQQTIEAALAGRTLILDARVGGLSSDGLLHASADGPAEVADDESVTWIASDSGRPVVPYRVRANGLAAEEQVEGGEWHLAHVFVLERNAEGEPTRALTVETWRDAATTEDARATGPAQTLDEHQSWVEYCARALASRLRLPEDWANVLALAARLHDEGKRAPRWQEAFNAPHTGGPYAKTLGPIRQNRLEGYRHEFGSLPYAERNETLASLPEHQRDLVLHLIAAHHGYARPLIPVDGCDDAPPSKLQERAREVALRFARLQRHWGPWALAWWEALLRAADQQASRENEERGRKPRGRA